ncbi:sodium- and chloride-dependent glycine transporter 2 [Trichonephila clavipes]|nr:sodium- and chloride-dependent glycine transporter 2 [Trichonephila clavipes]
MAEFRQYPESNMHISNNSNSIPLPHLDSSSTVSSSTDSENKRSTWSRQLDFFLSCVGYAVGLGNIWRFPYLCYKSGGGVGFGMAIVSAVVCVYYNVIIAWALYYIYQSYSVSWSSCENSWNTPNCVSQDIVSLQSNFSSVVNQTLFLNSTHGNSSLKVLLETSKMTSSEEFWLFKVLQQSAGIESVGTFQWPLVLTLFIAWILIFICVMRGIKSSGKVRF